MDLGIAISTEMVLNDLRPLWRKRGGRTPGERTFPRVRAITDGALFLCSSTSKQTICGPPSILRRRAFLSIPDPLVQ